MKLIISVAVEVWLNLSARFYQNPRESFCLRLNPDSFHPQLLIGFGGVASGIPSN